MVRRTDLIVVNIKSKFPQVVDFAVSAYQKITGKIDEK